MLLVPPISSHSAPPIFSGTGSINTGWIFLYPEYKENVSSMIIDIQGICIVIEKVYLVKNNETINPTWIKWDIIDFNGTERPPIFNETSIKIVRRKGEQTCCAFKLQLNTTFTNHKVAVKIILHMASKYNI